MSPKLKYKIGDTIWFIASCSTNSHLLYESGSEVFAAHRFINQPIIGKIKSIYVKRFSKDGIYSGGTRYYNEKEVELYNEDILEYEVNIYLYPSVCKLPVWRFPSIVTNASIASEINKVFSNDKTNDQFINGTVNISYEYAADTPEEAEEKYLILHRRAEKLDFHLPIVRKVMSKTVGYKLVPAVPMSTPVGLKII